MNKELHRQESKELKEKNEELSIPSGLQASYQLGKRSGAYFTTLDLLVANILGVMGGFISGLIPFSLLVKTWYPFVGGTQLVSGHHLLWMVIAYGLSKKKPIILLTALIQGITNFLLGANWGILEVGIMFFEGFSLFLGFLLIELVNERHTNIGWGVAGGIGNITQVPLFWMLTGKIFILHWSLFAMAMMFAFISGFFIAGILGKIVVTRIQATGIYGDFLSTRTIKKIKHSFFQHSQEKSLKGNTEKVIIENFSFKYMNAKSRALNNITTTLSKGETILIGGRSGSGKSTLGYALSGQIPYKIDGKFSGNINFFNRNLHQIPYKEFVTQTGIVFQNAEEQLITFTVKDEICFIGENNMMEPEEINQRMITISEQLGIKHLIEKSIHSLSAGEKQKVVIAANLMLNPKLLIFDEPLAFLDQKGKRDFIQVLGTLRKESPNIIILIIEHRLEPFKEILDKILLMGDSGSLFFEGTVEEYYKSISKQQPGLLRDDMSNQNHNKKYHSQKQSKRGVYEDLINFCNISFRYPKSTKPVFDNLSISIKQGEFVGILGDNGSGKSTLLLLIAHILNPIKGTRIFNSINYNDLHRQEFLPKIGFIFQNPEHQIFETTIDKEILYAPRNFQLLGPKVEKSRRNELYEKILAKFRPLINEKRITQIQLGETNPFALSWGQKRRLNLASIFSYDPDLLLIDEPFIGQDSEAIGKIFDILHNFQAKGKTVVIVSHDHEILRSHCNRIIDLNVKEQGMELSPNEGKIPFISEDVKDQEKKTSRKIKKNKAKISPRSKRKMDKLDILLDLGNLSDIDENPIQKLNPITKILCSIIITWFLFIQESIIILFLVLLLLLFLGNIAGIKPQRFLHKIRWIIYVTIIYVPLNTLFDAQVIQGDEILFNLSNGLFPIRRLALYYALRTGILVINLFSTSVIFTNSTNSQKLVYSLLGIYIPYRYAFSFMIGLRYIPLIQNESNVIEIAQRLRGSNVKKGTSIKKIFYYLTDRINTLLISLLRKIQTTTRTIEARGFGLYRTRTNTIKIPYKFRDLVAVFCLFGIISGFGIIQQHTAFGLNIIPSLYSIFKLLVN